MGSESQGQRQNTEQLRGPGKNRMEFDVLMRTLLGQLVQPPETPISTPMQQGISNLQSGAPWTSFGLGGGLADRLSGVAPPGAAEGGAGFKQGSFLPTAPGGQQGLQTREQLGLPNPREQMGPWLPSVEEIEAIGVRPVRPSPDREKMTKREGRLAGREARLESRIEQRKAAGKATAGAEAKLAKTQGKLAKTRGSLL